MVTAAGIASAGIMLDRVVAVVNSEAITWGELYKTMEFQLSRERRSLSPEQKRAIFDENEALFLEEMINKKLQLQEAEKLGITANANEVNAAIEGIKRKYSMTDEQFVEAIRAEGFAMYEYRAMLREQLTIGKVLDAAVRSNVYLSDKELNSITQGDAFYRLRQIFISDGPEAEEKVRNIMEELETSVDFSEIVHSYSEDPAAPSGGDLGFVRKSKMSKEFASAVEGLSPGQVSKPFKSAKGIHIIMVEQIRDIKEVLTEERFMEAYADWLKSLREKSFIEIRL